MILYITQNDAFTIYFVMPRMFFGVFKYRHGFPIECAFPIESMEKTVYSDARRRYAIIFSVEPIPQALPLF